MVKRESFTFSTAVVLPDKLSEVLISDPILYLLEYVCLGDKWLSPELS